MASRADGPDKEPSATERARLLAIVCPPGSVCHLCGGAKGPIRFDLRRWHPLGPSMDHVIPRSRGGTWDLWNLRPAHYGCNSGRRDRDIPARPGIRSRRWGTRVGGRGYPPRPGIGANTH
ncbi:HNH endonuclease [Microbacterium sp. J1-1]|uniref:HNH endonuclease n=1 Tax=Microbacterium sp. J1-1 TaxID=2992441 RepID=UPI0039B6FBD0